MVVIVEQIILQDRNSALIAYLLLDEFITFTRDERLNGYHTLSIEIPVGHHQISNLIKYNRLLFKDKTLNKWYEFVIKTIEKTDNTLKATCESSLYDTLYSFVDFVSFNSNLVMSGLTQILNAAVPTSSWQVGTSDIAGYFNLQATRKNLKQVLWEYLENTNGFIEERIEVSNGVITGRYIDILSRRGTDRGKVIYDDREVSEINVKIPDTDIYTAAFGYGKNEDINNDGETEVVDFSSVLWTSPVSKPIGQKWVQLPMEYLSTYGLQMTSYENADQTDPSELLQETYDWLLSNLSDKTEYSIKAADLKSLGYETEEIRIGDTIGVDIAVLGIKLKAEILSYQENYLEPDKNDFELANYSRTFTSILSSQRLTLEEIQRANQVLKASYIAGILAGWNEEINATSGFVYADPGSGIITYNALPESATKVVEIKGGSIRIANSKTAGEWDWKTVMTGDGIIADGVYTGTLTGLTIRTSADGDRLEMSAGSFKGYIGTTKRLELGKQDLRFYDPNGNYVGSIGADPDDMLYRTILIETPYSSESDIYNNLKIRTGAIELSAVDTNGSGGVNVSGMGASLEAWDVGANYTHFLVSSYGVTVNNLPVIVGNRSASGNRWGIIPEVQQADGLMEIGKYIDFHETDGDTGDYSNRLESAGGMLRLNGYANIIVTRTKHVYSTRTANSGAGTQWIPVGFYAKYIRVTGILSGMGNKWYHSDGFCDEANNQMTFLEYGDGTNGQTIVSNMVVVMHSGGAYNQAYVSGINSSGFYLNWSQVNTIGSGTIYMMIEVFGQ